MLLTGLILGGLTGLLIGVRMGRLTQHAVHRYSIWRSTVAAVPIAYRAAVEAIKAAVRFIALVVLAVLAAVLAWVTVIPRP